MTLLDETSSSTLELLDEISEPIILTPLRIRDPRRDLVDEVLDALAAAGEEERKRRQWTRQQRALERAIDLDFDRD